MNKKTPFDEPKMENAKSLGKSAWAKEQNKINNDRICNSDWKWYPESKSFSSELKDLVTKLLIRDQSTRLGSDGDAKQILAHSVF
jgi:hypothetical protein